MRYIPHTEEDIRRMLETIGASSIEELFAEIPETLRLARPLNLPGPLAESDLVRELQRMAELNGTGKRFVSFLGGGAYDHFIPAVIDHLISRSEFYTAYTPYQPEISQGTLQAIFEFQTLICQMTGMEVANASMYDGASACAEAVLMAVRITRRNKVLLSAALHPEYRETVRTYCRYLDLDLIEVGTEPDGGTDPEALKQLLDEKTAALVLGYPNFYGVIEELEALFSLTRRAGALAVAAVTEPVALGLVRPPGELGADMVVGEGQSFGVPLSYGGPYVGFFASRQKHVRAMPGRLVGETVDLEGQRGYVLTLATREQHIRRERATSNICSNEGLCALVASIYLALLGKQGLREVAVHNLSKAEYAKERIAALPGFSIPFKAPTFNEFVVSTPGSASALLTRLEARGILGGIALERYGGPKDSLLVCVTEQNSREEIDALVAGLEGGKR